MKRRQFGRALGARNPEFEIIDGEMVDDEPELERLEAHRAPAVQPNAVDDQLRDLLDQLVTRFDHSLREQERELGQLRRTVLDMETTGSADREELMLTQRICQVLERENKSLAAEAEELRGQVAERDAQLAAAETELRQLRRKPAPTPLDTTGMLEQLLLQNRAGSSAAAK